jgi:hypothetical protein
MLLTYKQLGIHKTIHILKLLGEAKQLSSDTVEPYGLMAKFGFKADIESIDERDAPLDTSPSRSDEPKLVK